MAEMETDGVNMARDVVSVRVRRRVLRVRLR